MPFAFGCPECGSKLKTAAPIPADRSIQCPKCKHTFTGKDTEVQEIPAPKCGSWVEQPNCLAPSCRER